MSTRALWCIPVLVIAVVVAVTVVSRNARWTPDGFAYARVAMQDAGLSPADALEKAESFYLRQPVGRNPRYRDFFTADAAHAPPAPGPIFRTRVLYPWVVSLVYPSRGLQALTDVSALAFIVAVLALYWLLLALARPWVAAVGAIVFALSPLELILAESDLTDMLAIACWVIALAGILHYLQSGRLSLLLTFGVATLLLALTRQALYLPIGAVAGAFIGARIRHDPDETLRSIALASALGVVVVANLVWHVLLHGASLAKELEIAHGLAVRGGAPADESLQTWYRGALRNSVTTEMKRAILTVLPLLAGIAMVLEIRRKETAALVGAFLAGLAPIVFDPSTYALPRILEAPLYPIVLAALAMGLDRLLGPVRQTRSANDCR